MVVGVSSHEKPLKDRKKRGSRMRSFLLSVPLVAAAMFGAQKATAEDVRPGGTNVALGISSVSTSGFSVSESAAKAEGTLVGGEKGSRLKYGFYLERIEMGASQDASLRPADSLLRESERLLQVSDSLIQQYVTVTLDKVQNGYAYITLSETNVVSMGGGGGTIAVNQTTHTLKIGSPDVDPAPGTEPSQVRVPSSVYSDRVYTITATTTDASKPQATIHLSEWQTHSRSKGNLTANLVESRVLASLAWESVFDGGFAFELGAYGGYGKRSISIDTPIGTYMDNTSVGWLGAGTTLRFFGEEDGLALHVKYLVDGELPAATSEFTTGASLSVGGFGARVGYRRYSLERDFTLSEAAEYFKSLRWTHSSFNFGVSTGVGSLLGSAIRVGLVGEYAEYLAALKAKYKDGLLPTYGQKGDEFETKAYVLTGGASLSAEKGPVRAELEVTGGKNTLGGNLRLSYRL